MSVLSIAPYDGSTIGVKQAMPDPAYKGYTTRKEELVKAERNIASGIPVTEIVNNLLYNAEEGELIKRTIAWKYTIEVKWVGLTAEQKNLIMAATGQSWCYVDFVDMDTDTLIEGVKMYRGSGQQVTGWGKYNPTTRQFQYYDITMSLIQA